MMFFSYQLMEGCRKRGDYPLLACKVSTEPIAFSINLGECFRIGCGAHHFYAVSIKGVLSRWVSLYWVYTASAFIDLGGVELLRSDGRSNRELRAVRFYPNYQEFAEGSVLIELGKTRVICSASIEERVPHFLRGQGKGWITAEYGMLPRSTLSRISREQSMNGGRTAEIRRLIGRSLRSVTELEKLGERTITLDCDVLQADGGTRGAAITGAYVAAYQALLGLVRRQVITAMPLRGSVAATSVGLVNDEILLDLCYEEDFRAQVDFNIVMSGAGDFIELQGTGEERPFSKPVMQEMLMAAEEGINRLLVFQNEAIHNL
jgi:ribonuclease PH